MCPNKSLIYYDDIKFLAPILFISRMTHIYSDLVLFMIATLASGIHKLFCQNEIKYFNNLTEKSHIHDYLKPAGKVH